MSKAKFDINITLDFVFSDLLRNFPKTSFFLPSNFGGAVVSIQLRLLWRKQTLRIDFSAAASDPKATLRRLLKINESLRHKVYLLLWALARDIPAHCYSDIGITLWRRLKIATAKRIDPDIVIIILVEQIIDSEEQCHFPVLEKNIMPKA